MYCVIYTLYSVFFSFVKKCYLYALVRNRLFSYGSSLQMVTGVNNLWRRLMNLYEDKFDNLIMFEPNPDKVMNPDNLHARLKFAGPEKARLARACDVN